MEVKRQFQEIHHFELRHDRRVGSRTATETVLAAASGNSQAEVVAAARIGSQRGRWQRSIDAAVAPGWGICGILRQTH